MGLVDRHKKMLQSLEGHSVEAGWFETARYQAGKDVPEAMVGVPVARIARIQEFGATIKVFGGPKAVIPARPFMRGAYIKITAKRGAMQRKISKQLVDGKISAEQAMGQIGLFMEGEIVDSIKNGGWVENAPLTEKLKGFNKPLIHTGQMWQAVASKVVKSK